MHRAIAKHLQETGRYEGVPIVVLEAAANDVLGYIEQRVSGDVTIELLSDLKLCESCDYWFDADDMIYGVDEQDNSVDFCEDCFDHLKADEAEKVGS